MYNCDLSIKKNINNNKINNKKLIFLEWCTTSATVSDVLHSY